MGEASFKKKLKNIIGFKPWNLSLYEQAFTHQSRAKQVLKKALTNSNERLEFLGDAVLDIVIADYLFKKYPFKDEGFLTEMRSKMVNREILSKISAQMGLTELINMNTHITRNKAAARNAGGNALEALVGAIYLDVGYKKTYRFVVTKLIEQFIDVDGLMQERINSKGTLFEWAQRHKKQLEFDSQMIDETNRRKQFLSKVCIDGEEIAQAIQPTKKKAEQLASDKACEILKIE